MSKTLPAFKGLVADIENNIEEWLTSLILKYITKYKFLKAVF